MKEYTAEEWHPSQSGLGESPLYRQEDDTFFSSISRTVSFIVYRYPTAWRSVTQYILTSQLPDLTLSRET
ncbi:hypothetical protein ANO14919_051540 [Xylariales sp. No.14919]|nr:hypothetical protein ANO14919_051540 [Xylariales sp. No.14919]